MQAGKHYSCSICLHRPHVVCHIFVSLFSHLVASNSTMSSRLRHALN